MTTSISPGPLVGSVVRSKALRGVALTETSYRPNLVIPKHAHRFPYFCAVLSGSFDDYAGSRHRVCDQATVFFRPAGEVHEDRFEPAGARCLAVELRPELIARLESSAPMLKEANQFYGGAIFAHSRRLHPELDCWDEFSPLAAEGLVLELIAAASRSATSGLDSNPRWLRQAAEILTQSFTTSLTLADVANAVRVHPTHLARVFRATYGCTVGEHIRARRIEFCRERLADPDEPLSTIALAAGFADQSHFCRVFKRLTGATPAEFRQRILGRRR
jgi:AraC family transcriptional regulator